MDQGNGNEVLNWRMSGGTSGGTDSDRDNCFESAFRGSTLGSLSQGKEVRKS